MIGFPGELRSLGQEMRWSPQGSGHIEEKKNHKTHVLTPRPDGWHTVPCRGMWSFPDTVRTRENFAQSG